MADKTISDLTAAAGVDLATLFEVELAGPISRKATLTQIQTALTGKQDALGFTPINKAGDSGMAGNFLFGAGNKIELFSGTGAANFATGTIALLATGGATFASGLISLANTGAASFAGGGASFNSTGSLAVGTHFTLVASSGLTTWNFNAGVNIVTIASTGISAGTLKISNVVDPTLAQDAATKAYVDSLAGGAPPFSDATALVKGSADATKLLRFEVDGISAGNTRVATPPNQSFTMAGLEVQQTFTAKQTITPPVDTEALVVSGASITGNNNQALLDLSGAWNTTGSARGIKLNIAHTLSDATSQFLDIQNTGSTVFSVDVNGFATMVGGALLGDSLQINSVFLVNGSTGLITFADGVRQIFNPNGTSAGINVGAHTADPSALVNGDLWYESTANELRARINGSTVALGAGGGASPPFVDTTAIVKGSVDATKLLRFEVDGFTAGATRVATPPNQDFTIAGINVAQTFSQKQTYTPPVNTEAITITGFSLTGANAQSVLDLAGTWNTSGIPTAIKLNITNTASSAASLLMDLQVGGASMFSVVRDGTAVVTTGLSVGGGNFSVASDGSFQAAGGPFAVDASSNLTINNAITFNSTGIALTDAGGFFFMSADLEIPAKLSFTSGGITVESDTTRLVFSSGIQIGTVTVDDDSGALLANTIKAATAFQIGATPVQLLDTGGDLDLGTSGLILNTVALRDDGGGNLTLNNSLKFGITASAGLLIATHSIRVADGTGSFYDLLCRSV